MVDPRLIRYARRAALTDRLFGVESVPVRPLSAAAPPFAAPAPAPTPPPVRVIEKAPAKSAAPPVSAAAPAERQAMLDAIRARYEADAPHQHFVTAHTNIVFGEGNPDARLMFIGEAPGADEDRTGRPFVGRAGQLLDKMIAAMGMEREQVYIANVLKTRPPNNATPTIEEARLCAPYLYAQIGVIRPEVIVTLGLPSTRLILETEASMARLRGSWASFQMPIHPLHSLMPPECADLVVPVLPTYHPAFLLRAYTQENRQKVWSDLRLVMERLG